MGSVEVKEVATVAAVATVEVAAVAIITLDAELARALTEAEVPYGRFYGGTYRSKQVSDLPGLKQLTGKSWQPATNSLKSWMEKMSISPTGKIWQSTPLPSMLS